ncbi:MAG: hypothetical protein ACRC8U_00970, partial [Brooklawnia sp.]
MKSPDRSLVDPVETLGQGVVTPDLIRDLTTRSGRDEIPASAGMTGEVVIRARPGISRRARSKTAMPASAWMTGEGRPPGAV